MNILLIGSGGREHAIAWKLAKSPRCEKLYIAPGNSGTATLGEKAINVELSTTDFPALMAFAVKNAVNLVVVGPEVPLVEGVSDAFKKVGIPVFGPSQKAAAIEGSKAFSKDFMKRHGIPTAEYQTFTDYAKARSYLESIDTNVVIKASGLAAGKGVLIPQNKKEALEGLKSIMEEKEFGEAGNEVVIEEFMTGQELSILAFTDGYTVVPFPAAQDHKRAHDGDQGPNTGGMGAYAPAPIASKQLMADVCKNILKPTVDGMRRDGYPFVGCLYAGLMLTPTGIKVLEYNCRFGDPETQVIIPLLSDDTDLAEVMLACAEHRLDSVKVAFRDAYAATVVIAAGGYPGTYAKGEQITIAKTPSDVTVFHAGASQKENRLVTSGGRVLAVTGLSSTLQGAVKSAYSGVDCVQFKDMFYRKDIAHRALTGQKAKTTYADAGVSIDAGNLLVEQIKPLVKTTRRPGSDSEIGGFGGLFDVKAAGFVDPILVSATDGVGTKLVVAHTVGIHDTIGIDLVAMNVNDLVVQGAEPLFFLDYYACGKLEVDVCRDVVHGVVKGCIEAGCALIGGETAEMPGLYALGDYDVAGFTVGAVERQDILPRMDDMVSGDVLLGIPSSGIHSNGYSLVRRVVANSDCTWTSPTPFRHEKATLGEALLTPTRIYVKTILPAVKKGLIKGMSHITGGGFLENIPRVLPKHLGAHIDASSWELPPVFKWLKETGNIDSVEMCRTFNCGVGMVIVVGADKADEVCEVLKASGEPVVYRMGRLKETKEMGGQEVVVEGACRW